MNDSMRELLNRVAAGDLDSLTPEQVAALEAHLNSSPSDAARLGAVVPRVDPLVTAISAPVQTAWEPVWTAISGRRGHGRQWPRRLLLWPGFAAAAAIAMIMTLWRLPARTGPDWTFQPAYDAEVTQVEVFGESTSMLYAVGDRGLPVVWVIPGEGA